VRKVCRFGREVALMRDAGDFVAGAYRKEYLGRAREQADDPHDGRRLFALGERVALLAVERVKSLGLDDVEAGAFGGFEQFDDVL
jgi:hypothetical protein